MEISSDEINRTAELEALRSEVVRLKQENAQLRLQQGLPPYPQESNPTLEFVEAQLSSQPLPKVTSKSNAQEKIILFRSLFKGREDVYAALWVNEKTGKKGYSPVCEDPWSLRKGKPKKYLSLTDQVIKEHLSGSKTVGIFPLLQDNTCWFLACDFDDEGWQLDAMTYVSVCNNYRVPAYLERSRSGNGGHVWIFFSSPVSATLARQLGMRLLRQTMDLRGDIDLKSYDRFFPNQDFMPKGGFGNLIALPLQKKCRILGNSEFLDITTQDLNTWPDQWIFLSSIQRLNPKQLEALLEVVPPLVVGPGKFVQPTSKIKSKHPAPKKIRCEFGATISLEKSGIPPWMLSQIKHLASLHNPQFYKNEKQRLSNYATPRFIKCYREDFSHIHLPRGTAEEVESIVQDAGSHLICMDNRKLPKRIPLEFHGCLRSEQTQAMDAVLSHDMGFLVAPPGAGKTVMGCYAIAKRRLPTLILIDRKPLLEQWRIQLMNLLGLNFRQIGQVGGGRKRQSGIVDLAMVPSLAKMENLSEFFSHYGFIVHDECHHVPAITFETCLREAPIRYILGLTATPYRRDGLEDIITMQCGPIRYKIESSKSNLKQQFYKRITEFRLPSDIEVPIQEVFTQLIQDNERNTLIVQDVLKSLEQGRRCLILSHRRDHC